MVAERGDFEVLSEPFSIPYYDGPESRSGRFACSAPDATFAAVRHEVIHGTHGARFVKDMTYQVLTALDDKLIDAATHTLLIRDPAYSLPSFARQWPDFTTEEAGFTAATEVVRRIEQRGAPLAIIDTADLRRDPGGTLARWCDHAGVGFDLSALHWEPGMAKSWERWGDWHQTTATSQSFLPPAEEPPTVDDPRLAVAIEEATPHYLALHDRRLRP